MTSRRGPSALAGALVLGVVLAGCGDETPGFDSGGTGGSGDDTAVQVGDEVGGPDSSTWPLAAGTLAFADDGAVVATCGAQVCRWPEGETRAETVGAGGDVLVFPAGVALEPVDDTVLVADVGDRRVSAVLEGHGAGGADTLPGVRAVGASPDGRVAVTTGEDGTVRAWSLDDGEQTGELDLPEVSASTPVLDPTGERVALTWVEGSADDPARGSGVFDVADGGMVGEPAGMARTLAWAPDGSYVVGTDEAGDLTVWPADDWASPTSSGVASVGPAAVSPDGTTVAFVDSDDPTTLRLWEPDSSDAPSTVRTDHPDPVVALAFSADGGRLASGSSQPLEEGESPPEQPRDEVQVRALGGGGDVVRLGLPDGTG